MSKMKELDIELDHILSKADPFRCEKSKKKTKAEIEDWSRRYCHAIIENSTVFRSDINPKATQAILDTLIKGVDHV